MAEMNGTERHEAYIRLMRAAPDLLKALHIIAAQSLGDDWTPEQAIEFAKQHAREAIAKAGPQP